MTVPERITVRLGPLRSAVARRLKKSGETYGQYVRRLIARDCGRTPPEMKSGNLATLKQFSKRATKN